MNGTLFLKGVLTAVVLLINTLVIGLLISILSIIKLLCPFLYLRKHIKAFIIWLSERWIYHNNIFIDFLYHLSLDVSGLEYLKTLDPTHSYFLIVNHQSFVDIHILQTILTFKIPPIKSFIKKSLLYVPLVGTVWWELDFLFMERYSRAMIKKHPELIEKDMNTIRKQCVKFKNHPVTILNFVEGTRFTKEKQIAQPSSYQYLLNPKVGGLACAIEAMQGQIIEVIDVTIAYCSKQCSLWAFLSGQAHAIKVDIKIRKIPPHLIGLSYQKSPENRELLKKWLDELWLAKDQLLARLLKDA